MGKLILLTGGARSGKSSFAEKIAAETGKKVLYIATSIPFDDEMKDRVEKHKRSRPVEWGLYEGTRGIGAKITAQAADYGCMLLDCVTLMVTNLMMDYTSDKEIADLLGEGELDYSHYIESEDSVMAEVVGIIAACAASDVTLIAVTNETGSGIVPDNAFARAFRDISGRANQRIARAADEVWLLVCGIPMKIK